MKLGRVSRRAVVVATLARPGASFAGNLYWNPEGTNHGGMEIYGELKDTLCDSNSVYMKGKVEGYGYTTLWNNYNGCGSEVYGDYYVCDPQALYVTYGSVAVCRNGILDNCYEQSEDR